MKCRRDGRKRKNMIQNPTLEHHISLEQALKAGMATCGLHYCKLKVIHQGRTGLPIVIAILEPRDFSEYTFWEEPLCIESYTGEIRVRNL